MNSPWRRNGSKRNSDSEEEKLGEKCLDPEQKLRSSQQSSDHCNLAPKIARNFVAEFSPDKNELEKEREGNRPCVSVMDEKISKDQSKRKLPEQTRKRWRKAAVCVTVICILVSLSLTIASFKTAGAYDSSSTLALAFDTRNALLCSLVLLWRFKGTENGRFGRKRERISCIVFVVSFILSGAFTTALSIKRIIEEDHPVKSFCIAAILSVACSLYFILAAIQCYISKKLRSSAMLSSSLDSGLSAFLMAGLLISDCTYMLAHTDLWYLDHSMAILVSIVSMLAGAQILAEVLVYKALLLDMQG